MEVAYSAKALDDIEYWKKSGNVKIKDRIATLIEDIKLHPFSGIGKPEPLKDQLAGKWSGTIDHGNRIIYALKDEYLFVYSLKGHY